MIWMRRIELGRGVCAKCEDSVQLFPTKVMSAARPLSKLQSENQSVESTTSYIDPFDLLLQSVKAGEISKTAPHPKEVVLQGVLEKILEVRLRSAPGNL